MKKMKKIMAMLLAMVMVLGMTVTAMAAGETNSVPLTGRPSEADRGLITVSGVEPGATVTAYQVVKAKFENKSFVGYEKVAGVEITDIKSVTATEVDTIAKAIKGGTLTGLESIELVYSDLDEQYKTINAQGNPDAPVGSYVILVKAPDGSTKVYSPMYGSVFYGSTEGGNTIEGGNIDVINGSNIWTKREDGPTPEKEIKDDANDDSKQSVTIGSTITYKLKATLPDYSVGYTSVKFNFVDTLSAGLTYNKGSYKVFVNGTEQTDKLVVSEKVEGQTITFELAEAFIKDVASDNEVSIEYTATVNENAASGFNPNTNEVVLDYSNSPDTETESEKDTTYNYTFDINGLLKKVDYENTNKILSGAKFCLYTDEECTIRATYKNGNNIPEATTGTDGFINFENLNEGTYYLKETVAPEDYQLSGKVYKIVIDANYDTDGKMTDYTITITDMDTNQAVNNIYYENENEITVTEVKNTKLSSLPSTGGIGTTIFTIGGCAIMIAAAGLFFASRRKANK